MRLSGGWVYLFWRLGFRQYSFSHITRRAVVVAGGPVDRVEQVIGAIRRDLL